MKNHLCHCASLLLICTFTLVQQVLQAHSTPLVQVHYLETQISDPPEDFEDPFDFHESWGNQFKQHGDSYFHIRWPGGVVRHHISAEFGNFLVLQGAAIQDLANKELPINIFRTP